MAIVRCFEEWRAELEFSPHPIQVLSDHKNLEYFMSTKLLSRRQARWSEFLSRFNFKIIYRPRKAGAKPDALTRRSGDLSKEGDERLLHQSQTVLKPQNLAILTTNSLVNQNNEPLNPSEDEPLNSSEDEPLNLSENIEQLWIRGYREDTISNEVLAALRQEKHRSKHLSLEQCKKENGRLLYQNRTYVSDFALLKLRIIQDHHDASAADHPGRSKTLELIARRHFWPKMRRDVELFCRNCHSCKRAQTSRHASFEILRPLPISEEA